MLKVPESEVSARAYVVRLESRRRTTAPETRPAAMAEVTVPRMTCAPAAAGSAAARQNDASRASLTMSRRVRQEDDASRYSGRTRGTGRLPLGSVERAFSFGVDGLARVPFSPQRGVTGA